MKVVYRVTLSKWRCKWWAVAGCTNGPPYSRDRLEFETLEEREANLISRTTRC